MERFHPHLLRSGKPMRNLTVLLSAIAVLAGLQTQVSADLPVNTLSESEQLAGWELLFDGTSTDKWRNYKKDDISDGWVVEDGALVRKNGGAGDIITKKQYESFEIALEFKISKGGNSGLMFHVTETEATPWRTGPEIQIQDNVDGHDPQKAGWLYQLYQPPNDQATGEPVDATRPAGEWNYLHVRISPQQSEIHMNGIRYARFKKGSDDWNERVAKSKFTKFPNFGKPTKGHICLQDHGNLVSFRNIKVRELDGSTPNPSEETLALKPVKAFPNVQWEGWEPVDSRGRPQSFRPIILTNGNDGSGRLLVAEQHGQIYALDTKTQKGTKVLDIREKVQYADRRNEEGLLGFACHPEFKTNGKFYVYYTHKPGLISVLSEFSVGKDGTADPKSEREIWRMEQPYWNHNGGTIAFGKDGYLYIGLGDGGAGNDPHGNGQNLSTLLGSILRIDVNSKSDGKEYGIPKDNPFVDQKDARPEIYAYGVRNVWRMAFDRKDGALWCADVGQNLWEEINIIEKGGNYGWNLSEANAPFSSKVEGAAEIIRPIWEYDHSVGKSITGGVVYRGTSVPELVGKYIYADYVTGKIWALTYDSEAKSVKNETIPSEKMPVITFGEGEDGEVYYCIVSPKGDGIYKFVKAE